MNLWMGTGRLTADPELRYVQSDGKGVPKVEFSIAINERGRNGDHTEYVDCYAWERLAETIGEYTRKGRLVLVTGQLRRESYTNKEGIKTYKTRVRAQTCEFLDRAPTDTPAQGNRETKDDAFADLAF